MATAVAMPKLGMTMEEGLVVEWPVAIGDAVTQGEVVLVIESEKADLEVEAPVSGVLRHIYIEPGETVPCGTLLAAIADDTDEAFDADAFSAAYEPPVGFESKPLAGGPGPSRAPAPAASATPAVATPPLRGGRTPVSPAARALARRLDVELTRVAGTGPGGRIVRDDVQAWVGRRANLRPVADGVALDVPAQGDGDTVLLLPGFGTDVSVFAQLLPALAKDHRVLGVNPRGVAGSDAPESDIYDIAQAALDAAALITDPAHVVGASLGSAVALELALSAPEKVRSLTLLTPFVENDARLEAVCDSWARLAAEVPPASLARTLLPWFFSAAFLADAANRERLVRGLATTLGRVPATTLTRTLAGLRGWSNTRATDLARITAPTLVIVAGADLLTPSSASVAAAIPNARRVDVPGAGHAVSIEAPRIVNDAITTHLATATQGARS